MVLEIIRDFLIDTFVDPITFYEGYNPINTITYAVIMFFIAFFIIFPYFNRKGIKFNFKFLLALLPYIFFATGMRILEDLQILERASVPWQPGYYLVSPGIWIVIGLLVAGALILSRLLAKKTGKDLYMIFGGIGLVLWLPVLVYNLTLFRQWFAFFAVLAGTILVTAVAYGLIALARKIKENKVPELMKDKLNILAVASQALDGTATAIAVSFYGYGEQHFVSEFVLGLHPALFIVVKVALTLIILYYIEKEIKDPNLRGFVKIILIILGSATGSRDVLTLAAGSNML